MKEEGAAPAPMVLMNPVITWVSEALSTYEEGCLSVPDIFDQVERPERCLIRYLDYDGKQVEEWAEDLYAVCIQHEMDHLDGLLFVDHISALKRNMILRKLTKSKKLDLANAAE